MQILVPCDFSKVSNNTALYAAKFAKKVNEEMRLPGSEEQTVPMILTSTLMVLVHCKVIPYPENIVKAPGFDRLKSGPYLYINKIFIVEPRELSRSLTGTDLTYSVLVGLSMPLISSEDRKWNVLLGLVLLITILSNMGKMFPLFCYRKEATVRKRLALSIAMFPRGEVVAGILVISMSYGLVGTAITVATLSLALNLLLTGVFIAIVKKLIEHKI